MVVGYDVGVNIVKQFGVVVYEGLRRLPTVAVVEVEALVRVENDMAPAIAVIK